MNHIAKLLVLCISLIIYTSCNEPDKYRPETLGYFGSTDSVVVMKEELKLFELLSSEDTGIDFINNVQEFENFNYYVYAYILNGGGVAVGDINNDGLPDLYFSGNMVPNRLYINEGDFKFRDISASSGTADVVGFATGVSMIDINNDGLLDIYVCKSGALIEEERKNLLYINNGDLTFTERAAEYGIDDASYSTQAYFYDFDGDGDLDLYLLNHPLIPQEANVIKYKVNEKGVNEKVLPNNLEFVSDRLYINNNGKFSDITKEKGLENYAFGLSAVIADFNGDLLPDILVCNDYVQPDYLYINDGKGGFKESINDFFFQTSYNSMGSDYADFNNDGCYDLMVIDMLPLDNYRRKMLGTEYNYEKSLELKKLGLLPQYMKNSLQLNNCNGSYSEIAFMAGVAATDWSWTSLFADFDNDGWKDLFISNGYMRELSNLDYIRYELDSLIKGFRSGEITFQDWFNQIPSERTRNHLYKNNADLTFKDVSKEWDVGSPSFSNGAVYVDLNNDGYLDLVVNNLKDPAFIMKNNGASSRGNNYIKFSLSDSDKKSVFGTQVKIYDKKGAFQLQYFYPIRGYLSSVEPTIHFGIGNQTTVEKVDIIWPDGSVQILNNLEINKLHNISKSSSGLKYTTPKSKSQFLKDVSELLPKEMLHEENFYIDFKREPLLYRKLSEEGPASCIGDVNGDGLDDIYIGGSMGISGQLFVQKSNGKFIKAINPAFDGDSASEDVDAVFFDFNGNGFLDLYVVSGGNEYPAQSKEYVDRLYINDGTGHFKKSPNAVPFVPSSGGCVAVHDINGDGKPDLFVGGRVMPGAYPTTPTSMILINEGDRFTNKTPQYSAELSQIGMVTDATFSDIDLDGRMELILCGEWMPISIFKQNPDNTYTNITSQVGIDKIKGWWYSIYVEDLDGDGYPEIIGGNLGLNNFLNVSNNTPVRLYASDFDENGSMDAVLTYYDGDISYPVEFRDKMLDQMVYLKKKFLRYDPYARATIYDIFSSTQLQGAKKLEANNMAHILFKNENGKYFHDFKLPKYSQISPIRSIVSYDINYSGNKDLLVGGNDFGLNFEVGPFDASVGAALINQGNLKFTIPNPSESGFFIPGNVRKIHKIQTDKGTKFLVVRNSGMCSLFELTQREI